MLILFDDLIDSLPWLDQSLEHLAQVLVSEYGILFAFFHLQFLEVGEGYRYTLSQPITKIRNS